MRPSIRGGIITQAILAAQSVVNLTSLFGVHQLSSGAEILLPTDDNVSNLEFSPRIQQRWTDYNRPHYGLGAIKPATPNDVETIVRVATAHSVPFFVTGGGHGVSDYHAFDGLSVDMGNFDYIRFSPDGARLTIGGAVKIKDLIRPLHDAGKELPLGSCACVGVVGATLGGGIGGLSGHRGLMLDALESVRIVTADRGLVEASATVNDDLFWAVRGAGSNFGAVTEATFRLHDASNGGLYTNADFVYPARANLSFWDMMAGFDETLPARMAINAVAFYNRVTDEPVIAVNVVYYGPESESRPHLRPFWDLGPAMSNVSTVPSSEIMDAAFFNFFGNDNGACTPNQHINIWTVALNSTHPQTFASFYEKLVDFWHAHPDYQGRLLMQRYATDGPLSVPDAETAYPHRGTKMFVNIEGFYSDVGLDETVNKFSREAREAFAESAGWMDEKGGLKAYGNYARGDEGPAAWYGERNLKKLADAKRKWDPRGQFSVHNPVPMHWP